MQLMAEIPKFIPRTELRILYRFRCWRLHRCHRVSAALGSGHFVRRSKGGKSDGGIGHGQTQLPQMPPTNRKSVEICHIGSELQLKLEIEKFSLI